MIVSARARDLCRRSGAPCLLAILLFGAGSAASEPPAPFGVDSARALVAELGPQKAAEKVSSDTTMLEAVAAGVASGRHEWLDVGVQLVGGADAYAYLKDRLVQAFSVALQHDPAAVLERGASGLPVGAVCGYDPFFGAETPPSRAEFERAVAVRERVVSGVKQEDLGAARDSPGRPSPARDGRRRQVRALTAARQVRPGRSRSA